MSSLKTAIMAASYEVVDTILNDKNNHTAIAFKLALERRNELESVDEVELEKLIEWENSDEAWKMRAKARARESAKKRFDEYQKTGKVSQYSHPDIDNSWMEDDFSESAASDFYKTISENLQTNSTHLKETVYVPVNRKKVETSKSSQLKEKVKTKKTSVSETPTEAIQSVAQELKSFNSNLGISYKNNLSNFFMKKGYKIMVLQSLNQSRNQSVRLLLSCMMKLKKAC